MLQEPDADVDVIDGEQGIASGLVESRAGNEESKKNLRDQLRRTLSKKESFTGEHLHTRIVGLANLTLMPMDRHVTIQATTQ